MEELLREVERALRARGWTARRASMKAAGTPELIRDMRRGRVPSVKRFKALCEALDLEFYVGPRRMWDSVDVARLEQALETADQVLAETGRDLGRADKAKAVSAIYDLIGEGRGRVGTARVVNLIEAFAGSPSTQGREDDREREADSAPLGIEGARVIKR